jgi:hypothetical protein
MHAPAQKTAFAARIQKQSYLPQHEALPDDDFTHPAVHAVQAGKQQPNRQYKNSCAHLLTVLTPLVIGELIKDPEKRWRWLRIGSVITALGVEVFTEWRRHIKEERKGKEEARSGGRDRD